MRRLGFIVAVVVLGVALAAPSVSAHALLLSSQPADGDSLTAAPTRIVFEFTERPDLALSSFAVLDAGGKPAAAAPARILRGETVELPLRGTLPNGPYTVSWRVVSTADGHLTAGSFGFGVGTAAPEGSGTVVQVPRYPGPRAQSVAGRWMLYAGLVLLLGAAVGGLFVYKRALPPWGWALPASWLLAAVGLGLQITSEANRAAASLGSFLGSGRGTALVRVAIGLGLGLIATLLVAFRPSRSSLVALAATGGVALLAQAAAGHAAAGDRAAFTVAVQWVHLLGVGSWVGGLPWLLVSLRGDADRDAAVRFARLAAVAVAVVAVSGSTRALVEVGSINAFGSTGFGRAVLTKIGLFIPLIALGAFNHYRHVPRMKAEGGSPRALRRSVRAEVAIGVAMLTATGFLAELPPSKQVAAAERAAEAAKPKPLVAEGADFATTVRARLEISPGRPGPNTFTLAALDYDTRRILSDVSAVSLRVALQGRSDLAPANVSLKREDDRWTGRSGAISSPGTWSIDALIERAGGSSTVALRVDVKAPPPRISVSRQAGLPTIYTAEIAGVGSVQVYADPGAPGQNEVHATYFDAGGKELPIETAAITLTPEGGRATTATVRRFGPGHFVADATLEAGRLTLDLDARARNGSRITLSIQIEIGTGS